MTASNAMATSGPSVHLMGSNQPRGQCPEYPLTPASRTKHYLRPYWGPILSFGVLTNVTTNKEGSTHPG